MSNHLNLYRLNENEVKDWLVSIGASDQERIALIQEMLFNATDDEMALEDRAVCLTVLEDLTGYKWTWTPRKDSRSLDTLKRVGEDRVH